MAETKANGTKEATLPPAESPAPRRPVPRQTLQSIEMPEDVSPEGVMKALYEENGLDFETGKPAEPEPEEEQEEEVVEEPTEAVVETDDGEEEESDEPEEKTLEEWSGLIRESPSRINEIPAKLRGEAIEMVLQARLAEEKATAQQTYQQMMEQQRQQWDAEAATRQAVAEIDQLRKEDQEAFSEWEEQYPDRAAAYFNFKLREKSGTPPGTSSVVAERMAAAAQIISRLDDFPEQQAKLKERAQKEPQRYDGNKAESLANVAADVAELLSEAQSAKNEKANEPTRKAAEARKKAADDLKAVPKPDMKSGSSAGGKLTFEMLEEMSVEDHMKLLESPEGEAKVREALAAGRKR